MIDTKMRDFLSGVEASQQYLIEVKMPSIKILEMVRKRINYIQEIKVVTAKAENRDRRCKITQREENWFHAGG